MGYKRHEHDLRGKGVLGVRGGEHLNMDQP